MFHWDRIHKHEEQVENDIYDRVQEYVLEFFEVDCIEDLTQSQIDELESFRNNDLAEYSVMQSGFADVIQQWENDQEYDDGE